MSGPACVIILGEDRAHVGSVYHAITGHLGVERGRVRKLPVPSGRGDAGHYVLNELAKEARALRRGPASARLIVCIDSDKRTAEKRRRELDDRVSTAELDDRMRSESIVYIVPKRNMETWLAFGQCQAVDEETNYKPPGRAPWTSDDHKLVGALLGQPTIPKDNPPASLAQSRSELQQKVGRR